MEMQHEGVGSYQVPSSFSSEDKIVYMYYLHLAIDVM